MKNTLRFSTHLSYFKVFLSFLLVITMVTTSLPIAYADTETNTVNALLNSAFDNGADNWEKTSGEINVKADGDGETATNALELTENGNAVYQEVTQADGKDFIQGSTFKWGLSFKNTKTGGKDDIVALILGLNEPAGSPDHLRQMITWLKGRKIDSKVPADGQYTVIVYSKPFKDNGTFENKTYVGEDGEDVEKKKENFSLVPTMYCTEKFSVTLFRTTSEDWKTVTNPETTPYTLNKNSASICYSLISYSGSPLVDDVNFFIEKTVTAATEFSNLQNGSFENPTIPSNFYYQPDYSLVPYWNTTAFGKKIELFKAQGNGKTGHYPTGNNMFVIDGDQAAELNADEASTMYQYIKTEAGSQYKWKLSHRGRHGADIMALVIGPKQDVDPSKDSKAGSDQFMLMVDWVKENRAYYPDVKAQIEEIETKQKDSERTSVDYRCNPVKVTVYSKPFDKNGGFISKNNNTYFSATETTEFSEKWEVTIIGSGNEEWETYGGNDNDMYSYYDVPEGQEDSIFAFTAYKATNQYDDQYYIDNPGQASKINTYGNLLDGVNFDLYYPASSVSFTGGDAVLSYIYKDKLLTAKLESGQPAKSIMVDENSTFTLDVNPSCSVTIDENGQEVPRRDALGNKIQNTFLGAYITIGGERKYFPATAINPEDHAVYFSETEDETGMKTYSFGQSNVSGRVVVELVYSEVYTMIYNSKGGNPYKVKYQEDPLPYSGSMDWSGSNANIARFFEKATCTYTSTACKWWENNPNVVFKGWELVGGKITRLSDNTPVPEGEQILFAEDVKVSYTAPTIDDLELTEEQIKNLTQNQLDEKILEKARSVDFVISDGKYEGRVNAYNGGVLVANWEYKTSVVAQTEQLDGSFINSGVGGQVSLIKHTSNITDEYGTVYTKEQTIADSDSFKYTSSFNNVVTVSNTEKDGYKFLGWYDEGGNKLTSTKDHSYTIEPYYSTDNKANKTQTPSVIYARFGLRCKVKFHINDMDTVPTVGNPDADLYRVYYPQSVDISSANASYKILNLDSENKIHYFYDIPPTESVNGKIFKGWYLDKHNNSDSNPIKWDSEEYKTEVNIYAHWIDVGTVKKDADDKKIIDKSTAPQDLLPGIDLLGVQIRYEDKDKNYPNGRGDGDGQSPHFDTDGLRFITCIKEDILEQTNSLFKTAYGSYTKKSLSYGYVIAKEKTANGLKNGEKLEYKDTNVNGVDTTGTYSFVENVDCTSKVGGYKNTSIVDHRNYDDYRIYSLVITYKKDGKTDEQIAQAKGQNIVARPYLRYQDANGLDRTYYQDYTGTNVYGGCSTNYTSTWENLKDRGYFPA